MVFMSGLYVMMDIIMMSKFLFLKTILNSRQFFMVFKLGNFHMYFMYSKYILNDIHNAVCNKRPSLSKYLALPWKLKVITKMGKTLLQKPCYHSNSLMLPHHCTYRNVTYNILRKVTKFGYSIFLYCQSQF